MGEHDGGQQHTAQPYAIPVIANATYIGEVGPSSALSLGTLKMRDGAGGKYINSIIEGCGSIMITGEALTRADAGDLEFVNNLFWCKYDPSDWSFWSAGFRQTEDILEGGDNMISKPDFSRRADQNLEALGERLVDLRPKSPVAVQDVADVREYDGTGFLQPTCYKGAFDPSKPMWARGWTATDQHGILSDVDDAVQQVPECNLTGIEKNLPRNGATVFQGSTVRYLNGNIAARFSGMPGSEIRLEVYSVSGKLLASAAKTMRTSRESLDVPVESFAANSFFVVLTSGNGQQVHRVAVMH
jgi:hypothetical protein